MKKVQIPSGRLDSLDALRGFDMLFIAGGGGLFKALAVATGLPFLVWWGGQMTHVPWHGFVAYDMIFPLFLFIAGISFPFSLIKNRSKGKTNKQIVWSIVRRGLILIMLGLVYNGLLQFDFANLRFASVLGRIGLAWMCAALLYLAFGEKGALVGVIVLLLGYWALFVYFIAPDAPAGADRFSMEGNIVSYIDRLITPGKLLYGYAPTYDAQGNVIEQIPMALYKLKNDPQALAYAREHLVHDPEGLAATWPAIATALLGMLTGWFMNLKSVKIIGWKKSVVLLVVGGLFILAGLIWDPYFPINKNLWTSSFVLFVAGLSIVLFSIFYTIMDVIGWKKWAFFFRVIGLNSITIYLGQKVISVTATSKFLFGGFVSLVPEVWQDVLVNGFYIFTCWLLLYFMYRNKWFLKV